MYHLHTTPAYVLQSYPHGESSRVYKLFTRELGLLYGHGQGVRELKNRNRYALATYRLTEVTLVRGREVWRLTGARGAGAHASLPTRRVLDLVGKLVPLGDPVPTLFDLVRAGVERSVPYEGSVLERLLVLRILDTLGYVAHPVRDPVLVSFLTSHTFTDDVLMHVEQEQERVTAAVNSALREAFA